MKRDLKDDLDIVLDDFKNDITDQDQAMEDIFAVFENHGVEVE
jgi:hypothetical protein